MTQGTRVTGNLMHDNGSREDLFVEVNHGPFMVDNNIFVGRSGLNAYNNAVYPVWMDGNVFLNGAKPSKHEDDPLVKSGYNAGVKLADKTDGVYLKLSAENLSIFGVWSGCISNAAGACRSS